MVPVSVSIGKLWNLISPNWFPYGSSEVVFSRSWKRLNFEQMVWNRVSYVVGFHSSWIFILPRLPVQWFSVKMHFGKDPQQEIISLWETGKRHFFVNMVTVLCIGLVFLFFPSHLTLFIPIPIPIPTLASVVVVVIPSLPHPTPKLYKTCRNFMFMAFWLVQMVGINSRISFR